MTKSTEISESKIIQALDWAYEKAINGVAGLDSATELAESYKQSHTGYTKQVNALIRWQNTKAGTSGFISGLGGIITLPVAIPANIATVMYVQLRMIAAIASIAGHNVHDDRIKALVYACLTGNAAKDIVKEVGIHAGTKLTASAIQSISAQTIITINKAVGFRLVTKFGEKGVINLGKMVPLVGGIIGGAFDTFSTNFIGNIARDTFQPEIKLKQS